MGSRPDLPLRGFTLGYLPSLTPRIQSPQAHGGIGGFNLIDRVRVHNPDGNYT
jgi:hypothetical protein